MAPALRWLLTAVCAVAIAGAGAVAAGAGGPTPDPPPAATTQQPPPPPPPPPPVVTAPAPVVTPPKTVTRKVAPKKVRKPHHVIRKAKPKPKPAAPVVSAALPVVTTAAPVAAPIIPTANSNGSSGLSSIFLWLAVALAGAMIIGGGFALTPDLALPRPRLRRAKPAEFDAEADEPDEETDPYIHAYAKFLDESE